MDWNHYGTFEHSEAPHVSDELNEEALMFPSYPHIPDQSRVTPCVPISAHHMEWCRSPAPNHRRFIPPSAGDSRSPCPALNALANHSILPHNGRDISAFQLLSAIREYYHISLPLAILLSLAGTLICGRNFKIDLGDLARHNYIEHDASLTHANAIPDGLYAPVSVDKDLLQSLLDVSKDRDVLLFDNLVTVRAARDATLSRPLSVFHRCISRGAVALTVQIFGDDEGNIPKQFIREWFGEQRLPNGWFKPQTAIGLLNMIRIANWIGQVVEIRREKVA